MPLRTHSSIALVPPAPAPEPSLPPFPLDPIMYELAGVVVTSEPQHSYTYETWVRYDAEGAVMVEFEVALAYRSETLLAFIGDYCEDRMGPVAPPSELMMISRSMCRIPSIDGPYRELVAKDIEGAVVCRLRMAKHAYHPVFDVLFTCYFQDERRRRTPPGGLRLL